LDANLHSRAMIASMIYTNANVPVESLNVKVAHDFEVLRHHLKDKYARETNDSVCVYIFYM